MPSARTELARRWQIWRVPTAPTNRTTAWPPSSILLILIGRRDLNLAEVQGRLQDGAVHTFGEAESLWSPSSAGLSFEVSDPPLNFLPVDAACFIHIPRIIDSGGGVLKAVGRLKVRSLAKTAGGCCSRRSERSSSHPVR